ARQKLKHTAFKELSEGITTRYEQLTMDNHKKFLNFRCIAFDASKIILPNIAEITNFFGATKFKTQEGHSGTYTHGMCECAYDMLNNIAIKVSINPSDSYEVDLAIPMLNAFRPNDLLIFDRGYASYKALAYLVQ